MTWINIPKEWNGNQALAVVEFLDELSAAIWKVHELKMLDAWHERETKRDPMTTMETDHRRSTDDFPF